MNTIFRLIVLICLYTSAPLFGEMTALQILQKVDQNTYAETTKTVSLMTIFGARGTRTLETESLTQGAVRSITTILAPKRDQGTKMLKNNGSMQIYYPRADRVVQIAKHMLKQSFLGSDFSFEDVMESRKLSELYKAVIIAEEPILGRKCFVLELKAVDTSITYFSRKIWVDQERMVALKEELFAKSGKKLKVISVKKIEKIDGRWYPTHLHFDDVLQAGSGTELVVKSIQFNLKVPDSAFGRHVLRR